MDELVETLRSRKKNVDWVNPWHRDFRDYVNQFKATNQSFQVNPLLCCASILRQFKPLLTLGLDHFVT
jgi:hypothetical protein